MNHSNSPTLHLKIHVKGLVQGVWFRKSTQQKANELGVFGWVTNQDDGSVYLEAEGNEDTVKALENWCHQGSPHARVDSVTSVQGKWCGFTSFEIRY